MPERFAEELSSSEKDRPLPRNEKIQSCCGSTVHGAMGIAKQEAKQKCVMNLCIVRTAHRASTEGCKMGGNVGVWGTPVVYR
jgi:hypothetical protein